MKSDWKRYCLVLFAALFVASSADAAARACMIVPGGHDPVSIQARDARAQEHQCPSADDAASCFTHCTQTRSPGNDAQRLLSDASSVVPVPPVGLAFVRFQPEARFVALAPAPPLAGPSLTILFRKLRI